MDVILLPCTHFVTCWSPIFHEYTRIPMLRKCCAKSLRLCPTLCDPVDCRPPGSSVHGIFQARILEWAVISSFRGSSWPRDWTCVSCLLHWHAGSLPLAPSGKPPVLRGYGQCYMRTGKQGVMDTYTTHVCFAQAHASLSHQTSSMGLFWVWGHRRLHSIYSAKTDFIYNL